MTAIWSNEAAVSAEKAVWLASDATAYRNGIMYKVLTPSFMFARILKAGVRIVSGKGLGSKPLSIEVVEPAGQSLIFRCGAISRKVGRSRVKGGDGKISSYWPHRGRQRLVMSVPATSKMRNGSATPRDRIRRH